MENDTDLRYIKEEMERNIRSCAYIDTLINNYKLNDTQEVINYKDLLNKYSITR